MPGEVKVLFDRMVYGMMGENSWGMPLPLHKGKKAIVGQCIGAGTLAAVGSAYTLMVFLISVLLGLAMGSGTVFSLYYGVGNPVALRRSIFSSFVLIGIVTLILNGIPPI